MSSHFIEQNAANSGKLRTILDGLYDKYNRFELIHPDPLEFVYRYENQRDRETAGFIAAALAYGRVSQILCSVSSVLDRMGGEPSLFLTESSHSKIRQTFQSFKHRFTTGETLSSLLAGLGRILRDYGSLQNCFLSGFDKADSNILPALSAFVEKLESASGRKMPMLLPSPLGGSACKRLNLFLRWMVRRDNVDSGLWDCVPACHLIIPLDTHMHRIALLMGLTLRKQADIKCAIEVTKAFGSIYPADPVRCDFALTRIGMSNGNLNEALIC